LNAIDRLAGEARASRSRHSAARWPRPVSSRSATGHGRCPPFLRQGPTRYPVDVIPRIVPIPVSIASKSPTAGGVESTRNNNRATTPSADFCSPIGFDHSNLSRESTTANRSPEVSSTAFRAQPPDLQPASLMDMGFAVIGPLARRRMPRIRFLFIGSRLCSALPSDPASRRRPCALLTLHLHQVG